MFAYREGEGEYSMLSYNVVGKNIDEPLLNHHFVFHVSNGILLDSSASPFLCGKKNPSAENKYLPFNSFASEKESIISLLYSISMNIVISDTYDAMSSHAATDLLKITRSIAKPVICTASGSSPAGLYQHLQLKFKTNPTQFKNWKFVGLDEWEGMNGETEGSCRFHLDRDLFGPLDLKEEQVIFFDGKASNASAECERIENYISKEGGIDVTILGLGMNGHIGMNEPGTPINSRSHLSNLDRITQQVAQKYFATSQKVERGLTLGLATILESRHIFLIVSGLSKADIVKKILEDDISQDLPASLLRNHPHFTLYLDAEAASKISRKNSPDFA